MLYTHSSELAVRATLFLALQPPGKLSPVHEIARGTGLSEPYLAKILRRLASAGLVRAFRGPGRGMELARAPDEISLWTVVRAMEGPERPEWCGLGLKACSQESPCALHSKWVPLRDQIQRLLAETTLGSLVSTLRERIDLEEKPFGPLGTEGGRGRFDEDKDGKRREPLRRKPPRKAS